MEIEKPQPAEKELIGNWIVAALPKGGINFRHNCRQL
jgi:hypothetical protein